MKEIVDNKALHVIFPEAIFQGYSSILLLVEGHNTNHFRYFASIRYNLSNSTTISSKSRWLRDEL